MTPKTPELTWDTLPGNLDIQIPDMQELLDRVIGNLDGASNDGFPDDYGLDELYGDLLTLRDDLTSAIIAVEEAM